MQRLAAGLLGLVAGTLALAAPQDEKPKAKKPAPGMAFLLKGSAEEFIKSRDQNGDGFLSKEELPPRMAELFEKFDRNEDGKLDRKEVEELRAYVAKQFGNPARPPNNPPAVKRTVQDWLARFDADQDGKISKSEAKGILAESFARIDVNGDGFLDQKELTQAAARLFAMAKGGPTFKGGPGRFGARPDFDALDKDADGRLTREEVKGTPFAVRFDEIDTNHDGKLDRKEFEAFLKKQEEGKKP